MTSRTGRWAWRVGAAGLVSVIVSTALAGPWTFLFGSVTGSAAVTRDAPCLPGREVPIMDSPHISSTRLQSVAYNSVPPTSGPHVGFTVATGVYTEPVSDGLTVHAMEHGHVIVLYAYDTPREAVRRLQRLAKRYSRDVILAPYPKLDHGIALTAWGRIDLFDRYDEQRIAAFVQRLRNRYVYGWAHANDCQQQRTGS